MTAYEFLLIGTVVALAASVQGTIGIGFALIVAPTLAVVRPQLLPAALLVLMLPLNLFVVAREHHALDWAGAGWITAGRVLGTAGGAALLLLSSPRALNPLVGGATILAAAGTLVLPAFHPTRNTFVTVGLVTGITETATGVGGPPLALAYQHHRPEVFRSSVAACFFIGELLSLGVLAVFGRVALNQLAAAALLVPFLVIGGRLSSAVRHRINQKLLRILVLAFALGSGLLLLFRR